jgi:predicted GH43/DUF377 family glycosyl hydrolase
MEEAASACLVARTVTHAGISTAARTSNAITKLRSDDKRLFVSVSRCRRALHRNAHPRSGPNVNAGKTEKICPCANPIKVNGSIMIAYQFNTERLAV